jgi:hypothetical protein
MEIDFRYKVDNVDFWDIVFLRNNKPRLVRYNLAMQNGPSVPSQSYPRLGSPVPAAR